jgi:hypothetical protein
LTTVAIVFPVYTSFGNQFLQGIFLFCHFPIFFEFGFLLKIALKLENLLALGTTTKLDFELRKSQLH